jgi:hypothetical protein
MEGWVDENKFVPSFFGFPLLFVCVNFTQRIFPTVGKTLPEHFVKASVCVPESESQKKKKKNSGTCRRGKLNNQVTTDIGWKSRKHSMGRLLINAQHKRSGNLIDKKS